MWNDYRWEYSPLAKYGNWFWMHAVDPFLSLLADDGYSALRGVRGLIQVILVVATLLVFVSFFHSPAHVLTASGLLFDIAGVLRLFLLEEINGALEHFRENEHGNLPSVAMRELIMPEASGPYDTESPYIKRFFYAKRGVLFLFIGFILQMIGDLVG
jgi:hypothetical protein